MSDSEEDYMSEKYLIEAEQQQQQQQKSYSERRKQQIREQQQKSYIKPRAQMEQEAREQGLNQSVSEDNKGMQMLMKMGFKKGMALGKSGGGMKAPIGIEMKQGRSGIGIKRALEEKAKEQQEAKRHSSIDPDDFRGLMAQRAKEGQQMRQSRAAASLIEKLDKDQGIETNILWIFNIPDQFEEEVNEQAEDNDLSAEQEKPVEQSLYPEEEIEALKALPLDERLLRLVAYLREEHAYCFWCAVKYNDQHDLDENCPGIHEDDH